MTDGAVRAAGSQPGKVCHAHHPEVVNGTTPAGFDLIDGEGLSIDFFAIQV